MKTCDKKLIIFEKTKSNLVSGLIKINKSFIAII